MMRYVLSILLVWGCVASTLAWGEGILTDDVVQTEFGAPLKVIVREDAAVFEEPNETSKSRPVRMFQFFYVLKVDGTEQGLKEGYYRVATGKSNANFFGWLKQEAAVEWPHREALGLRKQEGRGLAEFFPARDELEKSYAGENLEPLSREPEGGAGIQVLPILDAFDIDFDGDPAKAFRVAYMHSRNSKGRPSTSGGERVNLAKSTLDVVFVIDTTASMQPYIDATREVVKKLVEQIRERGAGAPVRFGIVGYRDVIESPDADWYVTKVLCDLTETSESPDAFDKRIAMVREATIGSEDFPEDLLAGIKVAATEISWNPDAFKHLILIGDASAHLETSGPKNPERLTLKSAIALAQPRGEAAARSRMVVHTIRIESDEPVDRDVAELQFKTLAAGDGNPGEHYSFRQSEAPEFVETLADTIVKSYEGLSQVQAGATPAANTPGLGILLDLVRASEVPDDAPHFASGFCCELDRDGNAMLEPHVLIEYNRLDLFNSALDFTVKALRKSSSSGNRNVGELVQSMKSLVTGVILGEPLSADTKLKDLLSVILGVPVESPVFDVTLDRLASMTDSDFESWVSQVDTSRSVLKSYLDNQRIWFSLDQEVPLDQRSAFIPVKDLP